MSILSAATAGTLAQQQDQRLLQLSNIASSEGLLGPGHNALVPNGLKTGFTRMIDFLSRPNFAIAGMWDVLQGTGDPDETAGGRILRELFSGVPGVEGTKETFGDVLRQGGYEEGGKLSDLVGENFLTKRLGFDPGLRGTVALGMDIFLDPTTYITFGSNGLMKVITKGGQAKWLTKAASKPVREAARVRWGRLARSIDTWEGLGTGGVRGRRSQLWDPTDTGKPRSWGDELEEAITKGDETAEMNIMAEIEQRFISRSESRMIRDDAFDMRAGWLKGKIDKAAMDDALKYAEGADLAPDIARAFTGADAAEMIARKRLRFFGSEIPGVSEPLAEGFAKLKATVDDAIESRAFLRASRGEVSKVYNAVGQFFNRDWGLRHMPGTKVYIQAMRNNYATHRRRITKNLNNIFGAEVDTNTDFWWKLTRAIDNPTEHLDEWVEAAAKEGFDDTWAHDRIRMVQLELRRSSDMDVHLGMLDPKDVREDYIPHQTSNNDMLKESSFTQFMTQKGKRRRVANGGNIGGYAEPRTFDTLDEFEALIAEFKKTNPDAEIDIIFDPRKLLEDRLTASARGWERTKFINKLRTSVRRNYRAELTKIVETEMPHLRQIIREGNLSDGEARALLDAFETELVYWKQPTASLHATDTGVRVAEAPADARAPKFRRPNKGEDSVSQMRRGAVKAVMDREWEARPLIRMAKDLRDDAAEMEAERQVHAGKLSVIDASNRTIRGLKRKLSDEEVVRARASAAESTKISFDKMNLAIADMRASLHETASELQQASFDLAKGDTLAQVELAMGREMKGLRAAEARLTRTEVIGASDPHIYGEYEQHLIDTNAPVAHLDDLDRYRDFLREREGTKIREVGKFKAAQRRVRDVEAQITPVTERTHREFVATLKGQTKILMNVDSDRLAKYAPSGKSDPELVRKMVRGDADPVAALEWRDGAWTAKTQLDADILASYNTSGVSARVRMTGKGSQSKEAFEQFQQTAGARQSSVDLSTASRQSLSDLAASRYKILSFKVVPKASTKRFAKVAKEHKALTTEIDDMRSATGILDTKITEAEATLSDALARVKKIAKRKGSGEANAAVKAARSEVESLIELRRSTEIDTQRAIAKLVSRRQALVDKNRKLFTELRGDRTSVSLEHSAFKQERLRLDDAVLRRDELAAKRDRIHREHVFAQEDAGTEFTKLSSEQKRFRKKATKVQKRLKGEVASVRESLAYSLEQRQFLAERRIENRAVIKRLRDEQSLIRGEGANVRVKKGDAYRERVRLNKLAKGAEDLAGDKLAKEEVLALTKTNLLMSSEETRAAFVYGVLANVEGLDEMLGVMERHGDVIESLSPGMMARMRDATKAAKQQTVDPRTGQEWVDIWVGRTRSFTDIGDARAYAREADEAFDGADPATKAIASGDAADVDDLISGIDGIDDEIITQADLDKMLKTLDTKTKAFAKLQAQRQVRLSAETGIPKGHVPSIRPGVSEVLASRKTIAARDEFMEAARTKGAPGILDWAVKHAPSGLRAPLTEIARELRPALVDQLGDNVEILMHHRSANYGYHAMEVLKGEGAQAHRGHSYHRLNSLTESQQRNLTYTQGHPSTVAFHSSTHFAKPGYVGGPLDETITLVFREAKFNDLDFPMGATNPAVTVIHELIHSVTARKMSIEAATPVARLTGEAVSGGIGEIRTLWREVRQQLADAGVANAGMKDLKEFVSYGLTDPETMRVLKGISRDTGTLEGKVTGWDRFVSAIRRVITGKGGDAVQKGIKTHSAWDELLTLTSGVSNSRYRRETIDKLVSEGFEFPHGFNMLDDAMQRADDVVLPRRARVTSQKPTTSTFGAARQKAASGRRPQLERWKVPKDLAKELEETDAQWFDTEEARNLLKLYDIALNSFKEWVTVPFPAFHFRNAYANLAAIGIDIKLSALNPRRHKQALDIFAGRDGTIDTPLGRRTYEQVRNLLDANDLVVDMADLLEMTGARRTTMQGGNAITRPIRRRFLNPMTNLGKNIEQEARALHFVTLLERGMTPEAAAAQVKRYLFDYGNLSSKEKSIMRRIFPFYTWQSKNVRNQIRNLYEKPGQVSAQVKPLRDRGPDNDALPEYLRGELQVRLEGDRDTPVKRLTNIDFPVSELSMIWRGSLDKTFLGLLNQINPLLKAPLEVAFNMDTFNGRTVNGRQWMGRNGPFMDKFFPKPLKEFLELDKVTRGDGTIGYTANGTKTHLIFKTWAVSRIMNTVSTADLFRDPNTGNVNEDKMFAFWKIMTGMEFREYDFTTYQREVLRNRIDRLESELVDRGVMRQFTKVYQPVTSPLPSRGR